MKRLVVTRIGPGASIQDLGRPGRMHEGIPPGGALCPELLKAANASVGNEPSAPALELPWHGAVFTAQDELTLSLDGLVQTLAAGEELRVRPSPYAVRYLALPGGIEAPLILGGRGALPVAGLGSFLRTKDVLRSGANDTGFRGTQTHHVSEAPIRLVLGPDEFGNDALDTIFSSTFTVSKLVDRTGMRLESPKLSVPLHDRDFSAPMVRGAIQVTTDGSLIVLGPDHPTTGGYPVIAVVRLADVGHLAMKRPDATVRFSR